MWTKLENSRELLRIPFAQPERERQQMAMAIAKLEEAQAPDKLTLGDAVLYAAAICRSFAPFLLEPPAPLPCFRYYGRRTWSSRS